MGTTHVMLGGAFISVGNANGVKITDFKLDGYQNVSTYKTAKAFANSSLSIVNAKGETVESFNFVAPYDATTGWGEGYWQHNGKKCVDKVNDPETEELAYVIPYGTGLWCFIGKGSSGSPITCTCAGQVLTEVEPIVLNKSTMGTTHIAICNPYPCAIDLATISLDGYQNVSTYKTAKAFANSSLGIVNAKGETVDSFNFVAPYDASTGWGEGYWQHNGKKIVAKGTLQNPDTEEEYDLPGGQGLWCFIGKGSSGSPIVIKFPALELK